MQSNFCRNEQRERMREREREFPLRINNCKTRSCLHKIKMAANLWHLEAWVLGAAFASLALTHLFNYLPPFLSLLHTLLFYLFLYFVFLSTIPYLCIFLFSFSSNTILHYLSFSRHFMSLFKLPYTVLLYLFLTLSLSLSLFLSVSLLFHLYFSLPFFILPSFFLCVCLCVFIPCLQSNFSSVNYQSLVFLLLRCFFTNSSEMNFLLNDFSPFLAGFLFSSSASFPSDPKKS